MGARDNPDVISDLQQTGLRRSEGMSEDERAFKSFPRRPNRAGVISGSRSITKIKKYSYITEKEVGCNMQGMNIKNQHRLVKQVTLAC
jgi:hypothetical protein